MYKAKRSPLDRVSTLPQPILETILCLLPTEEAARTSILSRDWRYKWTTIPKLEFKLDKRTVGNEQMSVSELTSEIASTRKNMDMHDVHQLLLLRQGPLHELTVSMRDYCEHYECLEFDQIVLHLSRNHTVKKLTLAGSDNFWYELPNSVFSLLHLTDLYLCSFDIDHPPTFDGFGGLGSLQLSDVKISTKTLLHLLSNSPSLKKLSLDISELDDKCTINELLKCLPVIEHLTISTRVFEWLALDSVPQELPTSLIHLKYIRLECLVQHYGLAFHVLIKCSPNWERFELHVYDIQEILLLREGPIHKITLDLPEVSDERLELDQILPQLSRNHMVKKLTLSGWDYECGYEVPISLFSFHHLRDLDISCLDLYHPPTFNGFGSLETLSLWDVGISTKTLLHLLSNCPSLKRLSLLLCEIDDTCTINELLECLPVIEHLTTWPNVSKWVVLDSVSQELPTSLIHLKYFCFKDTNRVELCGLRALLVFIKCSPNLEKIKLEMHYGFMCHQTYSLALEEYSDVWLEHLNEFEMERFNNTEPEMDFVKFILARSPKLKKVTITCIRYVGHRMESEMQMLKTLLQAPRVSPVVITVN
ncbi:hypothetical protein M8C21_005495 [Ambrosia artemisiifolia]|uniref:F-box domain, FBD domain, Leucine-rich repeat domain, L domain-like protein n=1 Tax=Ambrosia artemisiifolia TaxID=4212 RepID=A0AAD5BKJ0_AMBAR|nr:hypothetical protein M8C21_005495 [Ambrosia artemisiifolia]